MGGSTVKWGKRAPVLSGKLKVNLIKPEVVWRRRIGHCSDMGGSFGSSEKSDAAYSSQAVGSGSWAARDWVVSERGGSEGTRRYSGGRKEGGSILWLSERWGPAARGRSWVQVREKRCSKSRGVGTAGGDAWKVTLGVTS